MKHDRRYLKNNTKKIIFVTISMRGGGTERVIATLANHWIRQNYKVTILMIGGNEVAYKLNDGIVVNCVSTATGGNIVGRIARIFAMHDCFKSEPEATVIAMGTVAAMFSSVALFNCPNKLVVSERNDPNRLNHRPIKVTERFLRNALYYRADRVVFQTEMARELFPIGLKKNSCIIVNPIVDDLPTPSEYVARNRIVISAGRLTEQKNHRMLIESFVEFHKQNVEYKLIIYGEGEYKKELMDIISANNAEDYIVMDGFADNIYEIMNTSQIYVSSSDWEGLSNSLMEAMAMGMVVIATDCPVGGSRMLIKDGTNGRLIGVGNRKELVIALNEMADIHTARRYSQKATEVRDKYSVSNIAAEWEKLL